MNYWSKQKIQAQELIHKNYLYMVIAGLAIVIGTGSFGLSSVFHNHAIHVPEFPVFVNGVIGMVYLCMVVFHVFAALPIEYGGRKFFLENGEGNAKLAVLGDGFRKENWMRAIRTFVARDVLILVKLLLIIPGILSILDYFFVAEVLIEQPDLNTKEVLRRSKELIAGKRMLLAKFQLSFALWVLSSILTDGLTGVFYLFPYRAQARALVYRDLVANLNAGEADPAQ